jgi:putative CocE/NonD family hydrolase
MGAVKSIDPAAFGVEVVENEWIELRSGARLAARIWLPEGARVEPVPAIFEYLPYRLRDLTRKRDDINHGYFAAHGYACVRVDMQGSGDSDGVLRDQYRELELADGEEVIDWISKQPWCNGRVGMMGISWGGFNSLQVAARRPPALAAIVTVCSTDDLYADNMHYMGGCLLMDNLVEATTMFSVNSCPPDPAVVGDRWRRMWFERLRGSGLWLDTWLRHQRRDDYWRHGSVCEDYQAIACPVLTAGGWADAFVDPIFRLLEHLDVPTRAIVGPWAHCYPHYALPGPAIGFLQECVRWWDRWLKQKPNEVDQWPQLRAWMTDASPPATQYKRRPGRWVAEPSWPTDNVKMRCLPMAPARLYRNPNTIKRKRRSLSIQSPLSVGQYAGKWLTSATGPQMAHDQREEDGGSLVFDTLVLSDDLEILGIPEVELEVSADKPVAMLCARLIDVTPDDLATRVSYGLLNLTHRDGSENPTPLEPGERYRVKIPLNAVGQTFRKGHRIRLSLSTCYWPLAWPAPEPARVVVHTEGSGLWLPVRAPREDDSEVWFEPPEGARPPRIERLLPAQHDWIIRKSLGSYLTVQEVIDDPGVLRFTELELDVGEKMISRFSHVSNEYPSVTAETLTERSFQRGDWHVLTKTRTVLTATPTHFRIRAELDAYEGSTRVFSENWLSEIERDLV